MSGGVQVSVGVQVSGGCLGAWGVSGCLGVSGGLHSLLSFDPHLSLSTFCTPSREACPQLPHDDGRRLHHDEGRWVSPQPWLPCPATVLGQVLALGAWRDQSKVRCICTLNRGCGYGVVAGPRPWLQTGVGPGHPSALMPWSHAGLASPRRRPLA